MKVVKIIARAFHLDGTAYGHGGKYEVEDRIAKQIVLEGKGKVVKDLGQDKIEAQAFAKIDYEFLQKIRDHKEQVLAILEGKDEELEIEEDEGNEDLDNETDVENGSEGEDEGENDETIVDEDSIPENFPGAKALKEAGIEKLSAIPADREELLKVPGIGERTANQIGVTLASK